MPKNSNTKSAKVATAKVAKTTKAAAQLPAQLPAPQVPAKMLSTAGAQYHARKEAGVCVKCGQPLADGSKLLCVKHLEYHNNWHAERKARIAKAMALLAEQAAPLSTDAPKEQVAAAVLKNMVAKAQATQPVKPAAKAAKSKDLAALKATQPAAKPAAKKVAKKK